MVEPSYLDHHATTPVDPRVVEAMLPYFTEIYGNPSSLTHVQGRRAANAVEDSRVSIARFFGVQINEIYFTAGATESNNIALNLVREGEHFITGQTEHKSIAVAAERLRSRGVEVTFVDPDGDGFIAADRVAAALQPNTRLVSIEAANGEIGTIQAVGDIARLCRERGVLFHSDITQAAGKIDVDLSNIDMASFSAHKLYGPKGIGGLFVRRGVRIDPVVVGGGQEKNVRSGTVNVPGVIGMAAAFRLRAEEMKDEAVRLAAIRDQLRQDIIDNIADVKINGPVSPRLPGNLHVSFGRVDSDSLIVAMRRFALSAGSACSSGERTASRVLRSIGLSDALAIGSIRFGLGKSNTSEQASMLVEDLRRVVARLREMSAA